MEVLLKAEEMKACDEYTIKKIGIPSEELMQRAALKVFERLKAKFGETFSKTSGGILAGRGNNGGDARIVARLAREAGAKVTEDREAFPKCDWIVDGLFGTGLDREVTGEDRKAIETVNKLSGQTYILSIDTPSGLSSDTGRALPVSIQASETVSLGFLKRGQVTGEAANFTGRLFLENIGLKQPPEQKIETFLYTKEDAKRFPKRPLASHKGKFGHVYIWAGEEATEGATVLSALAALRSGAGLVTVVGEESLRQRLPAECMVQRYSEKLLETQKGSIFVLGPGMGVNDKTSSVLKAFLKSENRLILDADALTLISQNEKEFLPLFNERKGKGIVTLFTPHPKEASRLLSLSVERVEADRYAAVEALEKKWSGPWVALKGHGTLIRGNAVTYVVNRGDSGLAKGGTGDFLTGILAGIWAQVTEEKVAFPFGVYAHGRASELATIKFGTSRSTLASDLALLLPDVFKELGV